MLPVGDEFARIDAVQGNAILRTDLGDTVAEQSQHRGTQIDGIGA